MANDEKKKDEGTFQYAHQAALDDAMQRILNREKFSYDLNGDALYQQYKDNYISQGKRAMQDTMGQAAALTGGYGSSYAQNVGQQAYHSYLEGLNNVVPELYQLALDRYAREGDALSQQYAMYLDDYDRAYGKHRDTVADLQWQKQFDEAKRQYDLSYARQLANSESGSSSDSKVPTGGEYDNGSIPSGDIKTMQRILGIAETGYWGSAAAKAAGGLSADQAWQAYQKGQLQYRYSPTKTTYVPYSGTEDGSSAKNQTEAVRSFISKIANDTKHWDAVARHQYGSEKTYIAQQIENSKLSEEEQAYLITLYGITEQDLNYKS